MSNSSRDELGRVLCCHGRPFNCDECGEDYARELDAPVIELPDKHPLRIRAEHAEAEVARLTAAQGWQPIETYIDNNQPTVVWNGQSWIGFYQEEDGWFADVDGEMLRIHPEPTQWLSVLPAPPPAASRPETKAT